MAQIQYDFKKNDEYYTPKYAVEPILKYIKPNSTIWCPFDNEDSEYVKVFRENNFKVIFTHICNGEDFFNIKTPECDYIISNPPYSLKGSVFKKLYEIEKPFAMLINFQGLFDHKERFNLFKNNKFEIMFLNPRVNYFTLDNRNKASGVPFQSVYVCSKILKKQIEFESLNKK
jgi:hypothetical protein